MKKSIVSLILGAATTVLVTNSALAATACSGGSGTAVAAETDGTKFVRVAFTPKCSANTLVNYTDQVTNFAVAAGSSKGKTTFIGSTVGGGVVASGTCASGCGTSELGTALTAAEALSGSSSTSSSSTSSSSTSSSSTSSGSTSSSTSSGGTTP